MVQAPERACNRSLASAWRMELFRRGNHYSRSSVRRAVCPNLDLHAHIPTRRDRIQSAVDSNMSVGMNLAVGPVWRIKASALERNQSGFFFSFEDLDRYPTCCSMDTVPGDIATPDQSAALNVTEIDKGFTLEEALPHKTDCVFDDGLV